MGRDVYVQAQDKALVFCGWYAVDTDFADCGGGLDNLTGYTLEKGW